MGCNGQLCMFVCNLLTILSRFSFSIVAPSAGKAILFTRFEADQRLKQCLVLFDHQGLVAEGLCTEILLSVSVNRLTIRIKKN